MGAEPILAAILAWLATATLHSTAWLLGAFVCSAALQRVIALRVALALARERLFKLAIFGGLVTATLAFPAGRALPIEVPGARAAGAPFPIGAPTPAELGAALAELPVPRLGPGIEAAAPRGKISWLGRIPWLELAGGLWLAGVAGGATLWLRDRKRLSARLRGREPLRAGPAADLFARRLGERPSRRIILVRAPNLTAPITRGILRTEVCIPPRAERDLLDEEIEAMLAHEFAHARRRDPLLLAACRAIEVLFFFQPLLPVARRRLVEEIEILCDDEAARTTGDPAALASCLAEVATWIVAGSPEARAIAMAAGRSKLERRVGLLLDRGVSHSSPGQSTLLAPVAFAVVATALPLPAFAMRAAPPPGKHERAVEPAAAGPVAARGTQDALLEDWGAIRADLDVLEFECTSLATAAALANAPAELGDRLHDVRGRLQALRALETEVERTLAEITSAERQ